MWRSHIRNSKLSWNTRMHIVLYCRNTSIKGKSSSGYEIRLKCDKVLTYALEGFCIAKNTTLCWDATIVARIKNTAKEITSSSEKTRILQYLKMMNSNIKTRCVVPEKATPI